jgi:hypothetical protein
MKKIELFLIWKLEERKTPICGCIDDSGKWGREFFMDKRTTKI